MGCSDSRPDSKTQTAVRYSLDNQFSMYGAIQNNDFKLFFELIDSGFIIDFNMPNFSMKTPMHIAAEFGSEYILISLINQKAEINARDVNGLTPVFYAVRNRHMSTVIILEKHGADMQAVSQQGFKPKDYVPKGKEKQYCTVFREIQERSRN